MQFSTEDYHNEISSLMANMFQEIHKSKTLIVPKSLVMVFIIDFVVFNLFVAAENISLHFVNAFLFGPRASCD
jgi:hypothetical protein